jgi:hypothetical protein
MTKRKEDRKNPRYALDTISTKRGRGRPVKVVPSAVRGRADNFRVLLTNIWGKSEGFLTANSAEEIGTIFQTAMPGNSELVSLSPLFLKVLKEPHFPKRRNARINFLADSVAGVGEVTPRRSRDICAEQRKQDVKRHQILRYEFWIECSCGYKGRSENHSCKKCGAIIYLPFHE